MQKQSNFFRIRRPVFILIIFIFTLAIVTPVLADYLGPDRVKQESFVKTFDYGVWAEAGNGCFTQNGNPSDCIICQWEGSPGNACGSATYSYKLGTRSEVVTKTIILPPATISGSLQNCTLQNGWCITSSELFLDTQEPLSNYEIITIEGTLNGDSFACVASSCNMPLNEGNNSFTYWALSSWGDSSTKGTFTQKVDTVSPSVGLDVSGSNGSNGWYVSQAAISATGSDSTSGLVENLLSVDNGIWQSSTVLNDGVYNVDVRATDNAGNTSNSSTIISVDTTTPSLNVSLTGTRGKNNWYISKVKVSAIASDTTSGIALLEVSADGGAYQSYTSPISFSNGYHTYQFKATDKAGNVTQSPLQNVSIDTTFPAISLTEESTLGDTFYYDVQDEGSKLTIVRVVIDDEDERFPKVAWEESLSDNKFKDEILWDGKFKDGSQAPVGTYYVTIKATDAAGNESARTGSIKVELFSFLESIPEFVPPSNLLSDSEENPFLIQDLSSISDSTTDSVDFGGAINQPVEVNSQNFLLSTGTSQSSSIPTADPNVVWGIVALAVIGAATSYALEQKHKRKEDEQQELMRAEATADELNAAEEARKAQEWQNGQNILNAWIENALALGASESEIAELNTQAATQGLEVAIDNAENLNKTLVTRQQVLNNFRAGELGFSVALAEQQASIELQNGLMAYYLGMKAGEFAAANTPLQEPTLLENAWNWAFQNQVELSLGTGIAVGLAAIVGTLIGVITAPAWIVIGGAVLLTALLVTAGTIALNAHFGLDLGNNLATNVFVGTSATFITAGVGLLLTTVAPAIGTTITSVCAQNPVLCSQAGTIIDTGEQALLSGQLAYYTWIGDQNSAAQAAIELQLEQMDGGVPGNVIANEMGEQLAKLGDEATDLIATYGDDIVPLLVTYGDDAIDVISTYGDEGISLLMKYGPDTSQAISLVQDFGTPAVKVLEVVDPISASKLLSNLQTDELAYAIKQGPDAVTALSGWKENELAEFGAELALRAKKDANVIEAISMLISLGPVNPNKLTVEQQELITIIAENSMQYSDNGQIVLGKWVDYGNGFTYVARETGSVHYNPHPDMWELFDAFGELREETAWLVNKEVIQIGINKGLPFEYTLNGLPADKIEFEEYAIETIWQGGDSVETIYDNVKESLGVSILPVRLRELVELYSAGYIYTFDSIANSYIFIKK